MFAVYAKEVAALVPQMRYWRSLMLRLYPVLFNQIMEAEAKHPCCTKLPEWFQHTATGGDNLCFNALS